VSAPASKFIPIAAEIPGCPPRPTEILSTILAIAPLAFKDFERERK
jgi:energy-converting hydrogenase A subunit N